MSNYDYYYNGELDTEAEYSYDETGNIIQIKYYMDGELFMIAKYAYKEIKVPKRTEWRENDIFHLDL